MKQYIKAHLAHDDEYVDNNNDDEGTSRRAGRLTAEYEAKHREYDVRFHGAIPGRRGEPEPLPGPLVARFRGFGGLEGGQLVAGETSHQTCTNS